MVNAREMLKHLVWATVVTAMLLLLNSASSEAAAVYNCQNDSFVQVQTVEEFQKVVASQASGNYVLFVEMPNRAFAMHAMMALRNAGYENAVMAEAMKHFDGQNLGPRAAKVTGRVNIPVWYRK